MLWYEHLDHAQGFDSDNSRRPVIRAINVYQTVTETVLFDTTLPPDIATLWSDMVLVCYPSQSFPCMDFVVVQRYKLSYCIYSEGNMRLYIQREDQDGFQSTWFFVYILRD
jgi:hypothetical protein